MKSLRAEKVDQLLADMYSSAGIDKTSLRQSSTLLDNLFSAQIAPFTLRSEDFDLRTNMARSVITPDNTQQISIKPFPVGQLQSVLHLEPPKAVLQYVPSAIPLTAPDGQIKPKHVRARGTRMSKQHRLSRDPNMPAVASIYSTTDKQSENGAAPAPKRSRRSDQGVDSNKIEKDEQVDSRRERSASRINLPKNFYEVITQIFEYFWYLHFQENVEVAFFAKITDANCKEYGLEAFAEHSFSLPVIKEKVEKRLYISPEDFLYDFHHLFKNIRMYYPETHDAHRKAVELESVFESKFSEAKASLFVWEEVK